MADVVVPLTAAAPTGVTSVPVSITTGNTYKVRNNGRVMLYFAKTGAGNATITVVTPKTVGGLAVADQSFTVPATTGKVWAGPFPPDIYNDPSADVDITTDEGTAITVEAVQL
ncbi:hypothetical protein LCGC14_2871240 [marine sediment metagenome]|uniref:Uncharacterized protein n=1 Tax=marine sediment metagenome TaxID=412755 RepID=A0A0F8YPK0_9ZZZZ